MSTAAKLLDFVSQRQQGKGNPKCDAIADALNVTVPPTRLEKQAIQLHDKRRGHNIKSGSLFARTQPYRPSSFSNYSTNGHGDAFDTDAESLDDTSIIRMALPTGDPGNGSAPRGAVGNAEWTYQADLASKRMKVEERALFEGEEVSHGRTDKEASYEEATDGESETESLPEITFLNQGVAEACERSNGQGARFRSSKAVLSNGFTMLAPVQINEPCRDIGNSSGVSRACRVDSTQNVNIGQGLIDKHSAMNMLGSSNRKEHRQHRTSTSHRLASDIHIGQAKIPSLFDSREWALQEFPTKRERREASDALNLVIQKPEMISLNRRSSSFKDDYSDSEQNGNNATLDACHKLTQESHRQKHRIDLDYATNELAQMSYQQLLVESFDNDPTLRDQQLPADLLHGLLSDRLAHLFAFNISVDQGEQRAAFFSVLTIEQFEECGDLVIDRLGSIVSKFKAARRLKRKIAKEFEDEVARRQGCVREMNSILEEDLKRMRQNGTDIMKGGQRP